MNEWILKLRPTSTLKALSEFAERLWDFDLTAKSVKFVWEQMPTTSQVWEEEDCVMVILPDYLREWGFVFVTLVETLRQKQQRILELKRKKEAWRSIQRDTFPKVWSAAELVRSVRRPKS